MAQKRKKGKKKAADHWTDENLQKGLFFEALIIKRHLLSVAVSWAINIISWRLLKICYMEETLCYMDCHT